MTIKTLCRFAVTMTLAVALPGAAMAFGPLDSVARMEFKSGHETRDTGLFGDYWWANRFLNHHLQAEKLNGKPVDLVMVGDSITHMWEWHWKSWAKFTKGLTVFNFGYRGDATHNLIWRIEHGELDGFKAKCIVLMIGTNNNWPECSNPVVVAEAIKKIVGMIRERQPQAKLVMHPIFPRGNAPGSPKDVSSSARNKKTNEIIEKFVKEDGNIVWIDFSDKLVDETGWVPKSIMPDGLHPSDAGYEIWMNALKPITDELRESAKTGNAK